MSRKIVTCGGRQRPLMVLEQAVTVLVGAAETAGAYAVVEQEVPAGGGLPFLHTHPVQATFYVLTGRFEFYQMDQVGKKQTVLLETRGVIHVPCTMPHGFRNVAPEMGTLLVMFEPAGVIEPLFVDLDRLACGERDRRYQSGMLNVNELIAIFQKHELRIFEAPAG